MQTTKTTEAAINRTQERIEDQPTKPFCCIVECMKDAEWEIVRQDTSVHPADCFTHACSDHVGHLLDDGFNHAVYPIEGGTRDTRAAGEGDVSEETTSGDRAVARHSQTSFQEGTVAVKQHPGTQRRESTIYTDAQWDYDLDEAKAMLDRINVPNPLGTQGFSEIAILRDVCGSLIRQIRASAGGKHREDSDVTCDLMIPLPQVDADDVLLTHLLVESHLDAASRHLAEAGQLTVALDAEEQPFLDEIRALETLTRMISTRSTIFRQNGGNLLTEGRS